MAVLKPMTVSAAIDTLETDLIFIIVRVQAVFSELTFEHPLSEKIRTYLRVEMLFNQLEKTKTTQTDNEVQHFFRTLFDLNEVLDRCEWRSDLLKDLDKQRLLLNQWAELPQIDTQKVFELVERTNRYFQQINQQPKLANLIKEDRLLNVVRQRLALPGGACSFDLPQLSYWQHQSDEQRMGNVEHWLTPFARVAEVMIYLLDMLREQGSEESIIAHEGFYQGQREGCVLIRLKMAAPLQGYPTISGHKNRFAIKFMSLDGAVLNDLPFTLTCCRSFA
ncbi:cell division protein ZapD [Celerinatantimonas yamalensis]|uniref:Cell division protein ZapD n=1 Tax=Celerinatantimonas yamalensis TaxID=559956 RepID=A0ABW9G6X8_9GAMM